MFPKPQIAAGIKVVKLKLPVILLVPYTVPRSVFSTKTDTDIGISWVIVPVIKSEIVISVSN
jgi:hypothetical protein